ncbi:hypothetical protein GXM_02133 [Nostoc sphaeroides CCNUC1]|uniref:Uncharacterized protein n=1 Tax=Nostoc sphaeroides CCNUC1 TaxID=2653204 RepID=A0A5P8VW60_9NOSO|nr:hypothetical protein GXM_02133 [Nostoc sphaeroides CCNUC1]
MKIEGLRRDAINRVCTIERRLMASVQELGVIKSKKLGTLSY